MAPDECQLPATIRAAIVAVPVGALAVAILIDHLSAGRVLEVFSLVGVAIESLLVGLTWTEARLRRKPRLREAGYLPKRIANRLPVQAARAWFVGWGFVLLTAAGLLLWRGAPGG